MTDKNQPAFPLMTARGAIQDGLTIREYLAAMALNGMLSSPLLEKMKEVKGWNVAETALAHADDLIKELNKES